MTITLNMTTFYTCLILVCLVRVCQGKVIWPVSGLLIAAPLAYMVGHLPPDMHSPLEQWVLAGVNVAGPPLIGSIVHIRGIVRKCSRYDWRVFLPKD